MADAQQVQDLHNEVCVRAGLNPGMYYSKLSRPSKKTIERLEKLIGYMAAQGINSEERAMFLRQIVDGAGIGDIRYSKMKSGSFSPIRFGVIKRTRDGRVYVDEQRLERLEYVSSFLEGLKAIADRS